MSNSKIEPRPALVKRERFLLIIHENASYLDPSNLKSVEGFRNRPAYEVEVSANCSWFEVVVARTGEAVAFWSDVILFGGLNGISLFQ